MFHQGQLIATVRKHPRSQDIVLHPDQFRDGAPTPSLRYSEKPVGHHMPAPSVAIRSLAEYDQMFAVEVSK